MAAESDIASLRHDIRNLQQSMASLGQMLSATTTELKGLRSWVASLDTVVDGVRLDTAKAKGGAAVLAAVATAAGAMGALVEQMFHR